MLGATAIVAGEPAGVALGVAERGFVGLFCFHTLPGHRRRGGHLNARAHAAARVEVLDERESLVDGEALPPTVRPRRVGPARDSVVEAQAPAVDRLHHRRRPGVRRELLELADLPHEQVRNLPSRAGKINGWSGASHE
jgi:hypothetical protein